MSGILTIEGGSVLEANYGYPDLNFTVRLSAPSSETVSVHYRTSGNGTATEYIDYYNAVSGTLIFAPGETEKVFSVEVDGDYDEEADESIAVELYDPVNAGLEGGARFLGALGWILDDDGVNQKRALGVSNPVVIEGDAGNRDAVFTVSLSRALSTDQDLHYETRDVTASAGEDYLSRTGTLRILAGQTEATVRVPVIGDRAAESSGSFELVVTPGPDFTRTGFAHVGMATILDDDSGGLRPTISLEGARATEEAYGNNYLVYTVRLSSSYGDTVAVDYAFEPGTATKDYDFDDSYRYPYSGQLVFAPGETLRTIAIWIDGDRDVELDESVVLQLSNPLNAALAGGATSLREAGWIIDDDGLNQKRAVFVTDTLVAENPANGVSEAVFAIDLSRPSQDRLSFQYATSDGTAKAGRDYTAKSGTIVFEPGQTRAEVRVAINSDALYEAAENFHLRLLSPFPSQVGSVASTTLATATIVDGTRLGSVFSDSLTGTAFADALYGLGGNDFISGLGGDDVLRGGAGNDRLYGGDGRDLLVGDEGNDILHGGTGADIMAGGAGNDTYVVDRARDSVRELAGQGNDTVLSYVTFSLPANVENLVLKGRGNIGGSGNALANSLVGNSGNNDLRGGAGNDRLYGGGGADRMTGSSGRDLLVGGAGADRLYSGTDGDRLFGGPGEDRFVYRSLSEAGIGARRDRIEDFARGDDWIDLRRIDADTDLAGNQAFVFRGATAFSGDAGELRFASGILSGDVNGDGRADFQIELTDIARLGASDILL